MTYIRTLLSFTLSLIASVVFAQNSIDWGEMVPEQVYEYNAMTPAQGYYTPTETGVMRCYSTGDVIHVYADEAHENIIDYEQDFYGADGEKVRVYSVEAGKTLYFYNAFPMDSGSFRFAVGSEPITLLEAAPSPEVIPLSISVNYRASYIFSIPVKVSKCVLSVGEESVEITPEIIDSTVVLNWFATLRQWYREGKIAEGDILTVTLTGIRDITDSQNRPDFGDGLGKLVLNYTMAGAPAELIRQSGTPDSGVTEMKTYYLPEGEEGIVKLTFSSDIDPDCGAFAEIQYGDQDNIDLGLYIENPPLSIEGATVSVDLRGVTRFPEEMVPGLTPQPNIGLRVSGIKTLDGQYVLTGYMASPYSFSFNYLLRSVVYSIAADWLPAAGSALEAGTEMEIWVLNGQQIAFDSVDFTYVKDGQPAVASVTYADLRVEKDSDDALLFYLAAPDMDADPDSDITVTFGGLICADGLDHSSDIFVRYKAVAAAVGELEAVDSDAEIFDLAGRRVLNPSKGIYISNGKKVIIK